MGPLSLLCTPRAHNMNNNIAFGNDIMIQFSLGLLWVLYSCCLIPFMQKPFLFPTTLINHFLYNFVWYHLFVIKASLCNKVTNTIPVSPELHCNTNFCLWEKENLSKISAMILIRKGRRWSQALNFNKNYFQITTFTENAITRK